MIQLERYVGGAALRGILLVAVGLTALFSLLEFVQQLSSVGQGSYGLIDALVYVLLTVPSRFLDMAPASMLLGTLLVLGGLARNSELTALRALGISEQRIVGWILKLTVLIAVGLFLLAEFVIPPAEQYAQGRRGAELAAAAPVRNGDSFWAARGRQYLNVQQFQDGNVPTDIDIYAFAADGTLTRYIHAARADVQPDGIWLLEDVTRRTAVSASQLHAEHLASLPWRSFLPQRQAQLLILPPESMPPLALWRYVRDLERRGQPAARYEEELWAKIAIPFAMAAMVMIAVPFVFGPPRTQSAGQQIAIGALIGMIFTLCQQIAARLALLWDLNPALTALTPPLLLMALAVWLFRRAHR